MAVIQILANATRSSTGPTPPEFDIPAGVQRHVKIALTSPTFGSDASLIFNLTVFQSFDAGANWVEWKDIGFDSIGGLAGQPISKNGAIYDGLPWSIVSFDGSVRRLRVTATVNKSFMWGLSAEVMAA